jgi:hypothetical protein
VRYYSEEGKALRELPDKVVEDLVRISVGSSDIRLFFTGNFQSYRSLLDT